MAKATFIVTDMDLNLDGDPQTGDPVEFTTEKAAIKAAKKYLSASTDDEIWVWRLSHIVSRPDIEPDVEAVK